jgi:hypothetical protein
MTAVRIVRRKPLAAKALRFENNPYTQSEDELFGYASIFGSIASIATCSRLEPRAAFRTFNLCLVEFQWHDLAHT